MSSDSAIVVFATGKRLHILCSLPEWLPPIHLAGVWSPDSDERRAAGARYRVSTADTPEALLDQCEGAWVLIGGLATERPAVTAIERGLSTLAWAPFCAANDGAVLRLIDAVGSGTGRWRVAHPHFTRIACGPPNYGEHRPLPPEAVRLRRRSTGAATSWDELYGRAAVALASIEGLHPTDDLDVRPTSTSKLLQLEIQLRAFCGAVTMRFSMGEGPVRNLSVPCGAADAIPNGSDARTTRDWTIDGPDDLVQTARRHLINDCATDNEGITALQLLQSLVRTRR